MSEIDDLLKEIGDLESESEAVKPGGVVQVEWLAPDVTESESSEAEVEPNAISHSQEDIDNDPQDPEAQVPKLHHLTDAEFAQEDVVSELQERLETMKAEMDALRLRVAKAEEERDSALVQLSEAEEASLQRNRQMNLEIAEARRRESSLQEQAEELQQNLEDAVMEAKALKAQVQELQKKLTGALADKATAEAALESHDALKLEEEGKIKAKSRGRHRQGFSLLDLRASHRQRLWLKLRNAQFRCSVRKSASSPERRLQEGLQRLVEDNSVQESFLEAVRPQPSSFSPPPVVLRGGARRRQSSRSSAPSIGLEQSADVVAAEKWADAGQKQFAADALRRAVFSLSLQGI
mgnify:FL=1